MSRRMLGLPCVGWAKLSADVPDTVENWPEKVNRGCSGGVAGVGAGEAATEAAASEVGVGAIAAVAEGALFCRMAKAPWSLKNA